MATAFTSAAPSSATKWHPLTISGGLLVFMVFYAIAFPKGGIRIYGVPITFGYILTVAMLGLTLLRMRGMALPIDRLLAFLPCLLMGLWCAFVLYVNGTNDASMTLAFLVSALYLPFFGLVVFSPLLLDEHFQRVERAIVWAVRVIVVYGIFLFLYRQFTGSWIEIPYLTVNVTDVGQLDDKFINRGGIFKLISTYNNGNIFGVSMAIMAPLYLRLEKQAPFRWLVYVAMFLTLSRTVWIAAILIMFLRTVSSGVRPLTLIYLSVGLLVAGGAITGLLSFLGQDVSFIFDSNLGGRSYQLDVLRDVHILPGAPVAAIPEIAYLGLLKYYGLPGFLLFVLHLAMVPLLLKAEGVRLLSPTAASACLQGLVIYAIIAAADAAYSYIPVMMIYWMIAGLGLWYSHRESLVLVRPAAEARA